MFKLDIQTLWTRGASCAPCERWTAAPMSPRPGSTPAGPSPPRTTSGSAPSENNWLVTDTHIKIGFLEKLKFKKKLLLL